MHAERPIFALLILLALIASACDEGGGQPDAGAAAAGGGPPDLSALDPARCPAATPESFHGFAASYQPLSSGSWLRDKSFYLLTLFDALPDARAALTADAQLAALASQRVQGLQTAIDNCGDDGDCLGQAAKWSEADIATAGDALTQLAGSSSAVEKLVSSHLRPSGHGQLHADGTDAQLLRAAWQDVATALNKGWDDHVAGLAAVARKDLLTKAVAAADGKPIAAPLLEVVLGALASTERDEAGRYEPLAEGENSAAVARIASIDFAQYAFAAIVVPGKGPVDLDHPLDPNGQVRADQAAARFAAALAPLIILSGGHVHPDRTPYSEAVEMKSYLMASHAIAEDALLIDPHARHTTTNLRNVGRLLYRYGLPVDQPYLITTDFLQTLYIAAAGATELYGKRCLEELGYFPYRSVLQLDLLDDCWQPSVTSLHADARDLLDP